jgi:hypothetical protein
MFLKFDHNITIITNQAFNMSMVHNPKLMVPHIKCTTTIIHFQFGQINKGKPKFNNILYIDIVIQ